MEVDNLASPSSTPAEDRRKSGRATRRPEVFSQTNHSAKTNASGKRKRGDARENEDHEEDEDENENEDESDSDDVGDSEADEEELREKRRAARKIGTKPKKPVAKKGSRSAKKPKVGGAGVGRQLAFRPALNGRAPASRSRKAKGRPSLAAGEHGLFGEFLQSVHGFLSSV